MQNIFKDFLVGFYCDNTEMPQDQLTVGCAKSVPCIEMQSILSQSSNQSMMSAKTSGTTVVGNQEVDKPTKALSKVKALIIHNNKLIQEKQLNAETNTYKIKKKWIKTAQSYDNNCANMKGDMDRVDDDNTFVRFY